MNNQKPLTEETAKKLTAMLTKLPAGNQSLNLAKKPVYHIRNSQILAAMVGFAGITLVTFGFENLVSSVPLISTPLGEIILGLLFIIISGISLKQIIK